VPDPPRFDAPRDVYAHFTSRLSRAYAKLREARDFHTAREYGLGFEMSTSRATWATDRGEKVGLNH
jgi:hypothetical protein